MPMNSGVAASARPACASLDWSLDNKKSNRATTTSGSKPTTPSSPRAASSLSYSSASSPTSSSSSSSSPFSKAFSSKPRQDKTSSLPRYSSRALKVLYACEQFPIEHFAQFEITLDAAHDVTASDAAVEFELLYLKLDDKDTDKPPKRSDLAAAVVATQRATVSVPAGGAHEYFPVHFDELHLTLCNVTLHASLLGHSPEPTGLSAASPRGHEKTVTDNNPSTSALSLAGQCTVLTRHSRRIVLYCI